MAFGKLVIVCNTKIIILLWIKNLGGKMRTLDSWYRLGIGAIW